MCVCVCACACACVCVGGGCIPRKPLCVRLCYSSKRLRHDVENLCRKVFADAHFGHRIKHSVHWIHISILCATVGVQYVTFI